MEDYKAVTWTLESTDEHWCTMYFKVTEKSIEDLDTFTVIK